MYERKFINVDGKIPNKILAKQIHKYLKVIIHYDKIKCIPADSNMKLHGEIKISIKVNTEAIINVSIILTMVCNCIFWFLHDLRTNTFKETR